MAGQKYNFQLIHQPSCPKYSVGRARGTLRLERFFALGVEVRVLLANHIKPFLHLILIISFKPQKYLGRIFGIDLNFGLLHIIWHLKDFVAELICQFDSPIRQKHIHILRFVFF